MLIETTELTLGHVGLGTLSEVPLLALFATAQAHQLTEGVGHTLTEVTDASGARLYPGYMWLHLRVPPSRRLEKHALWDRVAVGVDVKRYGRMVLDSTYVLARPDELSPAVPWDLEVLPSMRANSVWVVAGGMDDPAPSTPKDGAIATLPAIKTSPDAIARSRSIRTAGSFSTKPRRWSTQTPMAYPVVDRRDVARGQNLMFATYIEVMGIATTSLVTDHGWPRVPRALSECRTLLEREVFFFAHTGGGKQILANVRADIVPCATDAHDSDTDVVSAGILEAECELYEAGTNTLLAVGRCRELFLVPRSRSTLVSELERFLAPR